MRHQTSRELFQYWNKLRGGDPAPLRHDFEPSYIGNILPSVFMLELIGDIATMRLTGGNICALYGEELRGQAFGKLWLNGVDRKPSSIAVQCAREKMPFVLSADGLSTIGAITKLEMLLLPMRSKSGTFDRVIGSLSDLDTAFPFSKKHINGMSLTSIRHIDRDTIPVDFEAVNTQKIAGQFMSDKVDRRKVGHLFIIDGGKTN